MKNYSNEVLNNLPGCVCEILQTLSDKYSNEPWYDEACDRYSYHVLTTDTNNVRMPGYIFSKYIKDNGLEHSEEICNKDYVKSILEHSGVKGMKKGVNKYRNPDGTLNEEGKRRYYASYSKTKENLEKNYQRPKKDENGKVIRDENGNIIYDTKVTEQDIFNKMKYDETNQNLNDSVKLLKETNQLVKNVENIIPREQGTRIYSSHPELTDNELRNKINRLKTEHEYSDLVGETKYIKSGSEKAREIIQTVGSSIAIVGSAAMVAATIHEMINRNKGIPNDKDKK